MAKGFTVNIIAHIYCDFDDKFGIPRQSGIVKDTVGKIVFEPEYRNRDALRGLDGYSHIWLLWQFSKAVRENWSPTVRPPKLGGNVRMGVFATRSPFRPNPIGISSVEIDKIELSDNEGPVIYVKGADLVNGTPIIDIKPYLPVYDSHSNATGGFTEDLNEGILRVEFPDELLKKLPQNKHKAIQQVLAQDPRPGYQDDGRIYKMKFAGFDIHFTVMDNVLTVNDVVYNKR